MTYQYPDMDARDPQPASNHPDYAGDLYAELLATRADLRGAVEDRAIWRERHKRLGLALTFASAVIGAEASIILWLAWR